MQGMKKKRHVVYGKYAHYWRREMEPLLVAADIVAYKSFKNSSSVRFACLIIALKVPLGKSLGWIGTVNGLLSPSL